MIKSNCQLPELYSFEGSSLCWATDAYNSPELNQFQSDATKLLEEEKKQAAKASERERAIGAGRDAACIFRSKTQQDAQLAAELASRVINHQCPPSLWMIAAQAFNMEAKPFAKAVLDRSAGFPNLQVLATG